MSRVMSRAAPVSIETDRSSTSASAPNVIQNAHSAHLRLLPNMCVSIAAECIAPAEAEITAFGRSLPVMLRDDI